VPAPTSQRILDVAERLVQTQGFNAFSYADIAKELAITKASLHYHFATKSELGVRLIERYTENFLAALLRIDENEAHAARKLAAYVEIYDGVLRKNRMCLCGMLAAEHGTLPKDMRSALMRFFDANESWLGKVLEDGRKAKKVQFKGPPSDQARLLVSALEGAMLVARSYGDPSRFVVAADRLLRDLTTTRSTH
jgi:TetR/AcrR family transcriptional regulator, transcriptional repressor for nem operon